MANESAVFFTALVTAGVGAAAGLAMFAWPAQAPAMPNVAQDTLCDGSAAPLGTKEAPPGMVWIPGGDTRIGSDQHYREEGPVTRVSVDGF
ncbi:hypothetical protein ACW7BJ_28970 [Azospirillum argentinense]